MIDITPIDVLRGHINQLKTVKDATQLSFNTITKTLEKKQELLDTYKSSRDLLTMVSQASADSIKTIAEPILSSALRYFFDDESACVVITSAYKYGSVGFDLKITDGSSPLLPMTMCGNSVKEVLSNLFRVLFLITTKKNRFLLLDESFAHLSRRLVERMGKFISIMCDTYNIQIVLVTHISEFIDSANKCFAIDKTGTWSSVEELK
jgi:predicted ATPase